MQTQKVSKKVAELFRWLFLRVLSHKNCSVTYSLYDEPVEKK